MRPGHRVRWLILVLPVLAAACAEENTGSRQCVMQQIADLPVLNDHGSPIVRATVDGKPVGFIVDTGAFTSTIGEKDVQRLGLPVDFNQHAILNGIGGSTNASVVTLREIRLGNAVARHQTFLGVGDYGREIGGVPVVGLFGGDFLANYDVEFDLPAHRLALYAEKDCGRHFRPWVSASFEQPFSLDHETEIDMKVSLNGRTIEAQLDSGAETTTLDEDAATAAGVTAASMSSDRTATTHGVDGRPVTTHDHRFDSLRIGPETFASPYLVVADIPRTLLGADYLRTHRVWVSYPHEMMYIQRVRVTKTPVPLTVHAAKAVNRTAVPLLAY